MDTSTNIYEDISARTGGDIYIGVVGPVRTGKSTFINNLSGRARAKTGDRPGVTTGKQWVTLRNGYELLDTPGMLWPKLGDQENARTLAYLGSIKDEILNTDELAVELIKFLLQE